MALCGVAVGGGPATSQSSPSHHRSIGSVAGCGPTSIIIPVYIPESYAVPLVATATSWQLLRHLQGRETSRGRQSSRSSRHSFRLLRMRGPLNFPSMPSDQPRICLVLAEPCGESQIPVLLDDNTSMAPSHGVVAAIEANRYNEDRAEEG